jgi:hypothetical protein
LEQCELGFNLGLGNAADQMGTYIVGLWRWGVVSITAYIEVVGVGLERDVVDDGGETVDGTKFIEGGDDLFDVFG